MPSVELIYDAVVCCSGQSQVTCHVFPALKFQKMGSEMQFSATTSGGTALYVHLMVDSAVLLELLKIGKRIKVNSFGDWKHSEAIAF